MDERTIAVFNAIYQSDTEQLMTLITNKSLLEVTMSVQIPEVPGEDSKFSANITPLIYAVMLQKIDIVKRLLLNHANVNPQLDTTPLIEAVKTRDLNLIKLLLDNEADIEGEDKLWNTPVLIAARMFDIDLVNFFIEKEAKISSPNIHKMSMLLYAIYGRNTELVNILLMNDVNVHVRKEEISEALESIKNTSEYSEMFRLIQERYESGQNKADRWKQLTTDLFHAIENNDITKINSLIDDGASVDATNEFKTSALTKALMDNKMKIVALLQEKGASLNGGRSMMPLDIAIKRNDVVLFKQLLANNKAELNSYSNACSLAYISAINIESFEFLNFLIKHGLKPISGVYEGYAPITYAAKRGNVEIVKFLVEHGADVNYIDDLDNIPFAVACEEGHVEVARYLYEKGADIFHYRKSNRNAFRLAIQKGRVEIIKFFLEENIDINKYPFDLSNDVNSDNKSKFHKEIKELILSYRPDFKSRFE